MTVDPPAPSPRRRRWSAIFAALAIVCWLLAGSVFYLFPAGGDLGQRVASGTPVAVDLAKSPHERLVWIRTDDADPPPVDCRLSGDRRASWSQMTFQQYRVEREFDGQRWLSVATIEATPAGTHSVVCTAAGGQELAIGTPPVFSTPVHLLIATHVGQAFILVGVVAAVLSIILFANRRRT